MERGDRVDDEEVPHGADRRWRAFALSNAPHGAQVLDFQGFVSLSKAAVLV
jgi:hypothetical protein